MSDLLATAFPGASTRAAWAACILDALAGLGDLGGLAAADAGMAVALVRGEEGIAAQSSAVALMIWPLWQ